MTMAHNMTPSQLAAYTARKDRERRMAAKAKELEIAKQEKEDAARPKVIMRLPPPPPKVRPELDADAHVQTWRQLFASTSPTPVKDYIATRALDYGFTYDMIVSTSRKRPLIYARHHIIWEVKRWLKPDITCVQLARAFRMKDHTTVLYAVAKIDKEREEANGRGFVCEDGT